MKIELDKQINNGALLLPSGVFKISGFDGDEQIEIHALDNAVIVLKKQMTAIELIHAMDALHQLAIELTVHLAMACGSCCNCQNGCPADELKCSLRELQDYLHENDGILFEAKFCTYMDKKETPIPIRATESDHDLQDVPPYLLMMLNEAGICLDELTEHLMADDILYD